jgi:hypothetical protein
LWQSSDEQSVLQSLSGSWRIASAFNIAVLLVLALYLNSQFFGRAGTRLVIMMVTFITGQGHGQATESTAKLRGEYDLIAPNPVGLEEKSGGL